MASSVTLEGPPGCPTLASVDAAPRGDPAQRPTRAPGGSRALHDIEEGEETPDGDRDGSELRGTRGRIGAPDHGGPGRAAARDADDARHRGARDDAVPPGQGPRQLLRRVRPGGRVRRRGVGDGRPGPPVHPAPRPRGARDPRRRARADLQPVHGPRGRHHRRPRRQRPLRRPHQGLRRHGLDAPRHDAGRDRPGDGLQAARARSASRSPGSATARPRAATSTRR